MINSGPRSHAIARLPLGNITLEVLVSDSLGASTVRGLEVQVKYTCLRAIIIFKTTSGLHLNLLATTVKGRKAGLGMVRMKMFAFFQPWHAFFKEKV